MSDSEDFMAGFGAPSTEEEEEKPVEKKEEAPAGGDAAPQQAAPAASGLPGVSDNYEPVTDKNQQDQLACVFAALLLNGDGSSSVEITTDKITAVLRAAPNI